MLVLREIALIGRHLQGTYGVMTHFWVTAEAAVLNGTIIRYYIDDEGTDASCGQAFWSVYVKLRSRTG